jgi:LAS superfamily LD-carboxypeptidase LdcB
LTSEERQEEILQTSTAPGVSRHHWGSDVDLFSTTPSDWADDGPMADHYDWLRKNAAHHGFIQPYTAKSSEDHPSISEERWHWSYYPVSEAILDFIRENTEEITAQLEKIWSYDPKRYTYIKENWKNYFFHVNESTDFD